MAGKAPIIVFAIIAVGVVVAMQGRNKGPAKPTPSRLDGPPPDAVYLDVGPSGVLAAARSKNENALDEVLGRWNAPTGWQGTVEAITTHRGQVALRLIEYDSTLIGGSYTIIAVVGENHGTEKGKTVHVQGRVGSVISKPSSAGMLHQIVLDDARIVK
jgi:hypothetical protein